MTPLIVDQILYKLLVGRNSNAAHSFKYDSKHADLDERYYCSSTSFASPISPLKFIYDSEDNEVSRNARALVWPPKLCTEIKEKPMQNNIKYLVISSTQMRLYLLRQLF